MEKICLGRKREVVPVIISFTGICFTLIQVIKKSLSGRGICTTTGCVLAHLYDTYGILDYIGVGLFSILFLLFVANFFVKGSEKRKVIDRVIGILLFSSLTVEGYFIGFQMWFTGKFCEFCLMVALFIFILNVYVWLWILRESPFIYFLLVVAPVSVFVATFLVRVPLKSFLGNLESPVVVFKSGCPHCRHLLSELKKAGIQVREINAKEVLPLFTIFNFRSVPIVITRESGKIIITQGEANGYKVLVKEKNYRKNQVQSSFFTINPDISIPFLNSTSTNNPGQCSIFEKGCNDNERFNKLNKNK